MTRGDPGTPRPDSLPFTYTPTPWTDDALCRQTGIDDALWFPMGTKHGDDTDKLQRSILDACTDAGVWRDDCLVVDVRARKFYAGEHELALAQAGVLVQIQEAP